MKTSLIKRLCSAAVCVCAVLAFGTFRAPVSPARAQAAVTVGTPYTINTLLPNPHAYLDRVVGLAADAHTVAVLTISGLDVFSFAADNIESRRTIACSGTAVALTDGTPVTLSGGTVTVHGEKPYSQALTDALDIAGAGDALYVLTAENLLTYALGTDALTLRTTVAHGLSNPSALTVGDTKITVTTVQNGETIFFESEIATVGFTQKATAVNVHDYCYAADTLYYLTDKKLTSTNGAVYDLPVGAVWEGGLSSAPAALCYDGARLLFGDSVDNVGCVQAYSANGALEYGATVLGSADSTDGRFNRPQDIASYRNATIVADTYNNRVTELLADGTVNNFAAVRPTEIETDGNGALFFLDQNGTRLTRSANGKTETVTFPSEQGAATDLALRGDNTMLIAVGGSVYPVEKDLSLGNAVYTGKDALRITASETSDTLTILTAAKIINFKNGVSSDVSDANGILDIESDAQKLYALYADRVAVIDRGKTETHLLEGDAFNRSAARFALNRYSEHSSGLGALLIAEPSRHAVLTVAGAQTQAAFPDFSDYSHPVDVSAKSQGTFTVKKLAASSPLSLYPSVSQSVATLEAGTTVLVVSETSASDFFCQIVVETPNTVTLPDGTPTVYLSGYVLKSALGASAVTVAPPYEKGRVLHPLIRVYKYPSIHAVELAQCAKDEVLTLAKSAAYTDPGNNKWVAVTLDDGTVGYTLAEGVVKIHYLAYPVKKAANATLHAPTLSGLAVYERNEDGTYSVIEGIVIPDRARVTLAQKFDSQSEYTLVTYYDDNGELTAYVATSTVETDGIGIIETLAIALIIVTLVIGVVVFCVHKKNKM